MARGTQYSVSTLRAGTERDCLCCEWTDIKWTRFAVGLIARHALELHYSLFANEHYAVTGDAYTFDPALYSAGPAR